MAPPPNRFCPDVAINPPKVVEEVVVLLVMVVVGTGGVAGLKPVGSAC